MNWTLIFTVIILLFLLRVFWAHVRANNAKTESYQRLAPKDKLAVLKECLLNNATIGNLQNLADFLKNEGLDHDTESYKPLLEKQLELGNKRANYVECDKLYVEQCIWVDKIEPLEFAEARNAQASGNKCTFVQLSLEGISKLYSDNAIKKALTDLTPHYPKAKALLEGYQALIVECENCDGSESSLDALRKKRDAWMNDLLTMDN